MHLQRQDADQLETRLRPPEPSPALPDRQSDNKERRQGCDETSEEGQEEEEEEYEAEREMGGSHKRRVLYHLRDHSELQRSSRSAAAAAAPCSKDGLTS